REGDELGRQRGERAAVAESKVDREVAWIRVPRRAERLAEALEVRAEDRVVGAGIEHADPDGLQGFLRERQRGAREDRRRGGEEAAPRDHPPATPCVFTYTE